jgi:hypothetical protein
MTNAQIRINLQSCPYLGSKDDPATWYSFSSLDHYCYKCDQAEPISPEYQSVTCLAEFDACMVYQNERWDRPLPNSIRSTPARFQMRRSALQAAGIWIALAVGGMVLVTIIGMLILNGMNGWIAASNPVEASHPTAAVENAGPDPVRISSVIVNSATPTASPTPPTPSATPTPSSTPAIESQIAYGSNLRSGPSTAFPIVALLSPNETVILLGRNVPGTWIFVRTLAQLEGWLALQQFVSAPDISTLPFGPGIDTPEPAQTLNPALTPEQTLSPTLK